MHLYSIITETWHSDGGVAFGVVPRTIWGKYYEADENNLIPMCNRLLLIHSGDHLILIDAGFGNKRDEKYYRYKYITHQVPLIDEIKRVGFNPEQVTDVVLTHLHDDHVGGAVIRDAEGDRLLFPHARHWVSRKQFEWAVNPNPREAASYFSDNTDLMLNNGSLKLVDAPGEILPGVEVLIMDGHTGGQLIPLIKTDKGIIAYLADFIPSKTHIPVPYLASVDTQPLIALKEKEEFLARAYADQYILFFEHDFYNEACRLAKGAKGIVAGDSFLLSEIFH
jgi:glyoxylase-like metal-dependent hydrolase (beta-lactamase superfamily II)